MINWLEMPSSHDPVGYVFGLICEISMDSMNLLMLCDDEILTEIQALSFTQR